MEELQQPTIEEIKEGLVSFREQIVQMEDMLPSMPQMARSLRQQYAIVMKYQEELIKLSVKT